MSFAGHHIDFATGAETSRAYLSLPASEHGPGVVVLQEWWGLVDHIREVCDRLAREGFVAFAPDLYRGEATADPDAAGRLMMDLEIPRAAQDLDGAVAALLRNEAVDGGSVAVIGFCMGWQLALYTATRNDRVAAVVDFYGVHPNVTLDLSGLEAAVMGIFAERDEFVPPEAAHKLESELRDAGKRCDFTIFPEVDHAFMNDTRPEVYDAPAAARGWSQMISFLRAEL